MLILYVNFSRGYFYSREYIYSGLWSILFQKLFWPLTVWIDCSIVIENNFCKFEAEGQEFAKTNLLDHGSYESIIMFEKCGRLDLTVFQLIWVIGTYGNWKNQNSGGHFGATS